MRFDINPQRVAVAVAAALLATVGLAYWLNLVPPLGGYDKFGFLFPHDQEQAPVSAAPLPAAPANQTLGAVSAPNLARLTPPDSAHDIATNAALSIRFDLPMDRASVEDALRIDPPAAGAILWDADNELRFSPGHAGLLRGVTYTVSLSNTARSVAGVSLAQPLTWSFRTADPVGVIAAQAPGAAIYPTSTYSLLFDRPMDISEANHAATLRAEWSSTDLPASLSWDAEGKRLTIAPAVAMTGSTITLRVPAEARTRSGEILGRSSEFTYTVVLPTPRLRLLAGRLAIAATSPASATGSADVNYEALAAPETPLGGVHFELYVLPGERLSAVQAQASTWPSALPGGFTSALAKADAAFSEAKSGAENPEVGTRRISGLLPGTYLLVASARSQAGTLSDWQLLVVPDRHLLSTNDGSLWATDEWGKVWLGAEISVYSARGELLEKGLTSEAGLWVPTKTEDANLAIARDPDGHLAILDFRSSTSDLLDQSKIQNPKSKIDLETDLPTYNPGQQVNFRALLHPPDGGRTWATPITEQAVVVSLLDPQGSVVSVLNLKPDNVGGVSGVFALAPALQPGRYALQVKMGDAWRDFPLPVRAASSDNLSVLIAPRTEQTAGSPAPGYPVSILGPHGEAASGAALTATLGIEGDNWVSTPVTLTADANGHAVLNVPLPTWSASYNDPGLYLRVKASWQGDSGSSQTPLDLTPARRLMSGVGDLVSPSMDIAAISQPQDGGAARLRIVSLGTQQDTSDLLVQAHSPSGESQSWSIDLANAGGDVTLPVSQLFAGGTISFAKVGHHGSQVALATRSVDLPPAANTHLALAVSVPITVASSASLPVSVHLMNKEGQGVEGTASIWFRRVAGDSSLQRGWEPSLHVEASGTAVATLSAPSSPGLWYLTCAVATADGDYTTSQSVINVVPGLTVQLPPSQDSQVGEDKDVTIAVYNPSDATVSTGIQVDGGELLNVGGSTSQGVQVPARDWQRLTWRYRANEPGDAALGFSFLPSAAADGRWLLPVKAEAGAHINTTYASGVLEGQKAVGVQVPSGLSDNQVQLEIRASDTLLSALADAASQLQAPNATHNPAAAAAALSAPGAVTSAYTRASLSVPARLAQSNIERSVALQQIYSAQHVDGGWGAELDPSVGPSTLGDTASVLLAIRRQDLAWTEAGDASFPPVDNTVIARGLSFLAWESSRPLDSSPSRQLLEERARGFYVLTLYGASKAEMIRPFMVYASSGDGSETGKAQLSPAGQAWLALALWQAGNTDDALALTERLRKDHDAAQIDEAEAGPVLEALLTIRVESRGLKNDERATGTLSTQHSALGTPEEAETYVRALMETRQGAGWSSPAVSADALWALSRYAAAANEKSGTTPTMVLDDHAVQSSAQPDNPGTISIALSGNALHAGTNWLKLQAPTLYYSLTLRAVR